MISELFEREQVGVRPAPVGADAPIDVTSGLVKPGAEFGRYTRPYSKGRLLVSVPCCGREALWAEPEHMAVQLVICTHCEAAYEATLYSDIDGGYGAHLRVDDIACAVARKRRN